MILKRVLRQEFASTIPLMRQKTDVSQKRSSVLKKSNRDLWADSTQVLKHWLSVVGPETGSGVTPRSVPRTDASTRASGFSIA
jgi:hypothetical protein